MKLAEQAEEIQRLRDEISRLKGEQGKPKIKANTSAKDQDLFHAESAAVVQAGLESSPWQHLDSTGTRVNGHNQHCHVLCNQLYTFYCTLPSKDRMSMLRVLQGGTNPVFRCNDLAGELMGQLAITDKWRSLLPTVLPRDQDLTEKELDTVLDVHLPKLGVNLRKRVKEALAIAAYRTQTAYPFTSRFFGEGGKVAQNGREALPQTHVARRKASGRSRPRMLSCFARGMLTIVGALIRGDGLLLGRFVPEPWPSMTPIPKKNTSKIAARATQEAA